MSTENWTSFSYVNLEIKVAIIITFIQVCLFNIVHGHRLLIVIAHEIINKVQGFKNLKV